MTHRTLFVAAALTFGSVAAVPAHACLNDREVIVAENQFKSTYVKSDNPGGWTERVTVGGWVVTALGVGLLGATAVAAVRSGKPRK